MELMVLRARAVCASCASKLPPRSTVWVTADSDDVWCETCGRFEQVDQAEASALGEPSMPEVTVEVDPAARPVEVEDEIANEDQAVDEASLDTAPFATDFGVAAPEPELGRSETDVEVDGDGELRQPEADKPELDRVTLDTDDELDRPTAVTSLVPRMRLTEVRGPGADQGEVPAAPADRLRVADPMDERADDRPEEPIEPEPTVEMLPRGDVGEGRVGQTLEAARIHGLEVLHGVGLGPTADPMQHLVVSGNGLWVIRAVPVLSGKLERQDVGDWFTADPRLFIGDSDRTPLVAEVRRQVDLLAALLARTPFSDVPVRGVLCFGSVQPGWVSEPFVMDGVSVTWRSRLVEPFLDPVMVDRRTRSRLVQALLELAAATSERLDTQTTEHPATG